MTSLADPYRARPYVLDRETAPAFWLVATLWLPMATGAQTGNRFSFLEQLMPTGLGPPTHRHPWADEGFYVLEGVCAFNANGETLRAGPGTMIHLPRMLPHSFSVDTSEARVVNFYAPAGFELVVMSCARLADERRRLSLEEAPPPNPEQLRILSRLFGQEEVKALPFAQPSVDPLMATEAGAWSVGALHVSRPGEAECFAAFGLEWQLLAGSDDTEGTYDLFEVSAPRGAGLPPHIAAQDAAVYVLDGSLDLSLNGQASRAGAGSFAYVPAGAGCTWRAASDTARLLVFHLPGGFDKAIARNAGNESHVHAHLEAMGTRFLAPPPGAAATGARP